MSVKHKLASIALGVAALLFAHSAAALDYSLKGGRWQMIAVPAYLPEGMNTPITVFGDEILAIDSSAEYGEENDWVMYSYNPVINRYDRLGADEPIQTEKGYWIIQVVSSEITVSLPEQSVIADGSHADMLAAELGCAPGDLIRGAESESWECTGPIRIEKTCVWTLGDAYTELSPESATNPDPYCEITCPSGVAISGEASAIFTEIEQFVEYYWHYFIYESYTDGVGEDSITIYVPSDIGATAYGGESILQVVDSEGNALSNQADITLVMEAAAVCL